MCEPIFVNTVHKCIYAWDKHNSIIHRCAFMRPFHRNSCLSLCPFCNKWASRQPSGVFPASCGVNSPLSAPSGGEIRDGDPPDEIPRVAAVRLLPGAGVRLQTPDGGHAGGAALRHCGVGGPCYRYMCEQHGTLQKAVQQDGGVSSITTI